MPAMFEHSGEASGEASRGGGNNKRPRRFVLPATSLDNFAVAASQLRKANLAQRAVECNELFLDLYRLATWYATVAIARGCSS